MRSSDPATRIPWRRVEPPPELVVNGSFASLEALREEWTRTLQGIPEAEARALRNRELRRLAIETGVLERIYDVDWGVTQSLVAEGFTRDVIERADGRVDDRTLATLRAQLDSLEMVLDFVHDERPPTSSFLCELHQAITRTQTTYVAIDSLGHVVDAPLPRGEWKQQPNWIDDDPGVRFETTPPEQVGSEIDRLLAMWADVENADTLHPIVRAAWLHHRFAQIHPFADGNGRVARALMLLVMEKHRYAPLVVDRFHRQDYMNALGDASRGDLVPLVRLLMRLESAALSRELELPEEYQPRVLAQDVTRALAEQLRSWRDRQRHQVRKATHSRALILFGRMEHWFAEQRQQLRQVFGNSGLPDVRVFADFTKPLAPPVGTEDRRYWFRRQINDSARVAGHYANYEFDVGWCAIRIGIPDHRLLMRFVASLHSVGRDVGVVAVTTFAELETEGAEEGGSPLREYVQTTRDAFRLVHSESLEAIEARTDELQGLLDEGLAEAQAKLLSRIARGGG